MTEAHHKSEGLQYEYFAYNFIRFVSPNCPNEDVVHIKVIPEEDVVRI